MVMSVARNFVSCFPYPAGNTEARKIVSWNSEVTIGKQIWIVARLLEHLFRYFVAASVGVDVGVKSCFVTVSQQLRDIIGYVEQLFQKQC